MSWLARSIANSLRIDDVDENDRQSPSTVHWYRENRLGNSLAPENVVGKTEEKRRGDLRGVKDDLSELRENLSRQLWGVANFLAPPPSVGSSCSNHQLHDNRITTELNRLESTDPSISGYEYDESSVYAKISTAGSDHSEIGGANCRIFGKQGGSESCKSSASSYRLGLQNVDEVDDEDEDEDDNDWITQAVGLTGEVLTFAGNIAHHPETWLDFPVEDEEDLEDFPMSESQKRHAHAVEHLTPRLAALRIELCPAHMSLGFFWKVYFVLLHSRLNKEDTDLLSTPEVVQARVKWMQELQKRAKKETDRYHGGHYSLGSADLDDDSTPRSLQNEHLETLSSWTFASEPATSSTTADSDTEKQVLSSEMQFTDKSIINEKPLTETNDKIIYAAPISKRPVLNFDDDDDDDDDEWPEDDCLGQNVTVIPVGIEDEVSFSDLEDDDCSIPIVSKP